MKAITGSPSASIAQMSAYIKKANPQAPDYSALYYAEGVDEGIDGAVAFAQSCIETGNWKFGGDVKASQNNFAGLGATGGGNTGNSFPEPVIGIRAQIQHLKAYANTEPLKKDCVDTRFKLVKRGVLPYVEWLGKNEGPPEYYWAAGSNYGVKILNVLEAIQKMPGGEAPKAPAPTPAPAPTTPASYVLEKQYTTNNPYWNLPEMQVFGIVVHSIGVPQPKAQNLVNNFNQPTGHASVHAFLEPGKVIMTSPCMDTRRKAKKCYHVGSGKNGSRNDTHIGIEMCEPSTIQYTGGSQFTNKDKANTLDYTNKVTETCAQFVADLCIFHGITTDFITTHFQSNKEGFGSAHADPEHLWTQSESGWDLPKFRARVQEIIKSKEVYLDMTKQELETVLDEKFAKFAPKVFHTTKDLPDWAVASVSKALATKTLSGTGAKTEDGNDIIDLSYDLTRTIVILDRAGVFDGKGVK